MEFCAPTILYLVISVISMIIDIVNLTSDGNTFSQGNFVGYIIFNILLIALWCLLLNYLCSIDWTPLAWALVLLPYIVLFLLTLITFELMKKHPELITPAP